MARLTKEAQETLDEVIEKYKDFIVDRATVYANQENNSLDVKGRHINMAARDYQNAFFYERKKINMQRPIRIYVFMMMVLAICILIIFLFLSFKSFEENYELIVLISSMIGIVAVTVFIVTMLLILKHTSHQKGKDDNRQIIVDYLNKWSEMESLLKNLYKKNNHKNPETIKDLLNFYQNLPSVVENRKQNMIFSLLQARNNLIHRGSKNANVKIILSLNEEIDEIIEILKHSN